MPTESELRSFLKEGPADAHGRPRLDATSIVRRSRRRRLPKQIAIGGSVTLAVAGISIASIQGLRLGSVSSSTLGSAASDSAEESAPGSGGDLSDFGPPTLVEPSLDADGMKRAPASKLNLCGGTLADVAPSVTGLVATTSFADGSPADGSPVTGTVTLTNTGTERISGTTDATPAITLSSGGTVLWHSNGPMIAMAVLVDLAPGASQTYDASFTPVQCAVEDDMAESFRADLPALAAGAYEVSAALDIMLDTPVNGSPQVDLVTGPTAPVTLG